MGLTAVAFMNCSPDANFQNDDDRFKSLVDGQTVEVVDEDTFEELSQEDTGLGGNDDGGNQNDGGINNGNGTPGGQGETMGHTGGDDDDDDMERPGNRGVAGNGNRTCRQRIMEQERRREHSEMVTSPNEMQNDIELNNEVKCGKNGKKVLVCHHPSGDASKRKTLCVGAPALKAFIQHMKASSVNFAGACPDSEENPGAEGEE